MFVMLYFEFGLYLLTIKVFVFVSVLSGAMLSNQNPMYIGMDGCESNLGYFKGLIDDVSR